MTKIYAIVCPGATSKYASVPPTPRSQEEILESPNLKSFSFNDIKLATRNFRPDSVLGEGGFGCVFKGWINEDTFAAAKAGTGLVIAAKRLRQESFQGHKEWLVSIKLSQEDYHVFRYIYLQVHRCRGDNSRSLLATGVVFHHWVALDSKFYWLTSCNFHSLYCRQKLITWGSWIILILSD